jgi:tetraacyldisaccharide 4'-kinase
MRLSTKIINLLRIISFPFSFIFYWLVKYRNISYDLGLFKAFNIEIPVISVGSISAGGSGKTPLTEYIARYFLSKGIKTGIIFRGYKKIADGIVVVSEGKLLNNTANVSGDEAYMVANSLLQKFNNFVIISSKDRVKAAQMLKDKYKVDIIILEDAFQHRKIKRNLDIVILDKKKFNSDLRERVLLPSGNLREPINSIKRANIVFLNNKFEKYNSLSIIKTFNKPVINCEYKFSNFLNTRGELLPEELKSKKTILFSGIANNASFSGIIKELNLKVKSNFEYPDHYSYSESDISILKNNFSGDEIFLTTEKDFVKVKDIDEFCIKYPVYFLKFEFCIRNNLNILYKYLDSLIIK